MSPATAEFFARQPRGLYGFTATCNKCRTERSKLYHSKNPDSRIAAGLKFKYGLTLEQWNEMFSTQLGRCKICSKHQSILKKRLAVDHDHATGRIRGLLCQHCNQMLGHAFDNSATMRIAANYLEQTQ